MFIWTCVLFWTVSEIQAFDCIVVWLGRPVLVSQEERSIIWEVIVSVILAKMFIWTCVLFWTVSEIQAFDCIVVWLGLPVLVSQEERSIFWEVIVSVILSKNVYMNMYPILNCFRDRGIWLCSGLAWAPSIVPSRRAAPLSEACESVWSVSWLLWLLIVTLLECCENAAHLHKCRICWYDVCLWLLRW